MGADTAQAFRHQRQIDSGAGRRENFPAPLSTSSLPGQNRPLIGPFSFRQQFNDSLAAYRMWT
jgi:hypothetical protein